MCIDVHVWTTVLGCGRCSKVKATIILVQRTDDRIVFHIYAVSASVVYIVTYTTLPLYISLMYDVFDEQSSSVVVIFSVYIMYKRSAKY